MSKYSTREDVSENGVKNLSQYPQLMQQLLFYRGIKTAEDAQEFLNPNYDDHIHDPFLLKNMDKVVERILYAIGKKEKIIIYSDYDCDGIPGAVVLHDFFKKIKYENVRNHIPHRHRDGYGLNTRAIEEFAQEGIALVITVDCGITDAESVARANELGIEVIITDHHLVGEVPPEAFAILNPKQAGDEYPFKDISGAGVAFKLVQALIKKGDFDIHEGWEKWLLDMVGLAAVADMVPLLGENRSFVHYGLKVLRKSPRVGLMKLCRKIKVNQKEITEDDIGFMIAPRINAASRMDVPFDAFKLLVADNEVDADELSVHLNKINDERKGVVASIVKEIKKKIADLGEMRDVIVMGNPNWRPALLGLVANTVMEEYERPVFLWGRDGGEVLKGSCRSYGGVNLVTMMKGVKDVFVGFGGHAYAGGFSVETGSVHTLEDVLNESYREVKDKNGESVEEIYIDKSLSIDEVNWDTYKIVEQFAPFGLGNPKPLFLFSGVEIHNIKHFGKEKSHLQLDFKKSDGKVVSAIAFFKTNESFERNIEEGEKIDLVATMEKSMFRNFPELRLRIVDIF